MTLQSIFVPYDTFYDTYLKIFETIKNLKTHLGKAKPHYQAVFGLIVRFFRGGDDGDRPSASHTYGSATQCFAFGTRLHRFRLKMCHRHILFTPKPSRVRSLVSFIKTKNTAINPVFLLRGGDDGDRTHDLLNAIQALSQLSYAPTNI